MVGIPVPMVENIKANGFNNETETSSNLTTSMAQPVQRPSPRSESNKDKKESVLGLRIGEAEDDSDPETTAPHPLQQERTRQKKFIKNFKHLQEETVFQRKFVGFTLLHSGCK